MAAFNRTRGTQVASCVRLANTHWSRLRGLIGTTASRFQCGHGLWIVPCHGVHTFAMQFPLDLIYLDRLGNVIEALTGVRPWRIAPVRMRAISVLELPAGAIQSSRTESGDQVEILSTQFPHGDVL